MVSLELWMVWSDTKGFYEIVGAYCNDKARERANLYNQSGANGATDWRPVKIPSPRQIEATEYLLAACEAVISAGESENLPTTVYDAIEAAIAKANGESATS